MKVGREIAIEAKKKHICKKWFSEMLKINDIQPLCEMYFAGDDWAMENDFPNLEILRKFKGNSEQYGLFTDFIGPIDNRLLTALFGNSEVNMLFDGWAAGIVTIRHNSKVKIVAKDNAFLTVNLLDNASVEIVADGEMTRVKVHQYGTTSKFTVNGNVEISQKTWAK